MQDKISVVGIGEILWDVLPEGRELGGAPGNFTYHAMMHGANAMVLSAVGDDKNGREILDVLASKQISADLVQINNRPTGWVDVLLNDEGIPHYTIHENVAWDFITLNEEARRRVSGADIVCFGSLAQRNEVSRAAIKSLLRNCKPGSTIVYDINLRQNYYSREIIHSSLLFCNVLKLNEEELPVVKDLLDLDTTEEEDQILELINKYGLKLLAYTKGSEGSLLMTPFEQSYKDTPKVEVKDTVGAGDSFTAAMSMGFTFDRPLAELHQDAVDISAFVCTQNGAMPDYKK